MNVVRTARTLRILLNHTRAQFPSTDGRLCLRFGTQDTATQRGPQGCVVLNPVLVCIAALLILVVLAPTAEAKTQHVLKVRVRFLATGSLIRGTWGSNQDQYLVEVAETPKSDPILARLLDDYATYQLPLSHEALISPTGSVLKVRRDPGCDIPYSAMQLRTAPGDSLAIVQEKLSYQPKLSNKPAPDAVLPCYRPQRPRDGF